jgi:hypothetical protein
LHDSHRGPPGGGTPSCATQSHFKATAAGFRCRFDEHALSRGFKDNFGVWIQPEPVAQPTGDCHLAFAGQFHSKTFRSQLLLVNAIDWSLSRQIRTRYGFIFSLVEAIRREDPDTLITVGGIPWALVWPNARPVSYSERVKRHFDFVSVHFHPRAGEINRALEALRVYQVGLPIVIEKMAPLHCSLPEFARFVEESREIASGGFMFFWGKTIEQYHGEPHDLHAALMAAWLEYFRETGPAMRRTE